MFTCKNPESCRKEMLRRAAIQARFHSRNEEILKAAQKNKATSLRMKENSHASQRELFRMYSRREIVEAFFNGKLIYSSYNKMYGEYRFVVKHNIKSSETYERPVHLVVAAHKSNLFDWTVITVIDPSARKWKWDDKYETQICFCDREIKMDDETQ
jgi:hypothetical protein